MGIHNEAEQVQEHYGSNFLPHHEALMAFRSLSDLKVVTLQDRPHLSLQRSLFQLPEVPAQINAGVIRRSPNMLDVSSHLVSSFREMWTAINSRHYFFFVFF